MKKENGKLFLAIKVVAALFCACQPEIPEIVEPKYLRMSTAIFMTPCALGRKLG